MKSDKRTLARLAAAAAFALPALGAWAQDYQLTIVDPGDEDTVLSDHGEMTVRAAVMPELAPGDRIELLVDGLPAAAPATTPEFSLSGVSRGLHILQARIIDPTGNVGSISPSDAVYVEPLPASVSEPDEE